MQGALRPWVEAQSGIGDDQCCTGYLISIAVASVKETILYNTFVGILKGNKFYLQKDVEMFEVTGLLSNTDTSGLLSTGQEKSCAFRDKNGHSSWQYDLGRMQIYPVPCTYL